MKHDMEKIREALAYLLSRSFPGMEVALRGAMLDDAIDELDRRRLAAADDGRYLDRASLLAHIESLTAELATARAGEARLRDTAERWLAAKRAVMEDESREARDAEEAPRMEFFKALAATDASDWLAKHDAEVRAPMEKRIAELEVSEAEAVERAQEMEMRAATTHENARATYAAMRKDIDDALEKKAELTQQLNTLLGGA